jgi:GT2 family glycosyltransferase/Tfp pilus assembly protein PilF
MLGNFLSDCSIPLLSIIIPVHNQAAFTRSCLVSLAHCPPHIPFEIIIVDDASMDETPELLSTASSSDSKIHSLRNESNLGFAASCNRGAAAASGQLLFFLNNDTEVLPDWFPPLYNLIMNNPDIGMVAPKLIFPDGTIQHCGKVWSSLTDPLSQPHHIYYRFPGDHPAVNKSRDYQMLTGACLLVRTVEFREIGGFDEGYCNGWEDDDLCFAYLTRGKRVHYCASSTVIHHQSKTLNERMSELETSLPDVEKLAELDRMLAAGEAAESDLDTARHVQSTFQAMERELLGIREKFSRNRSDFISKWGGTIRRDDLHYCTLDNIPLHQALSDLQLNDANNAASGANLPLVSIVILARNRLDVTRDCIASIQEHTPENHEIILIDNGSVDGTVEWLRNQAAVNQNYRLFENSENRGFSAGCNQGILAAKGKYILLLNNDVVVTPGWLGGMLECFSSRDVGIVGPMTNNISGAQKWPWVNYDGAGGLVPFALAFREQNRYRRISTRRIVGFCMLFPMQLVEQIGLLDEQFGSGNFEDDDYCLRATLEGYHNVIAADVFIHHVGSATFQGNRIDYTSAMQKNQALFNEKWSRPVVDAKQARKIIALKTLEKAETLRQRGDNDAVVDLLLREGVAQLPDEPTIYLALAGIFMETGMAKDALDVLRESPEAEGKTAVTMAQAMISCGMFASATDVLNELSLNGDNADVFIARGQLLLNLNDRSAAGAAFERALQIEPASAWAYSGLATLAQEMGDSDLAFLLAERAFRSSSTDNRIRSQFHSLVCDEEKLTLAEQRVREARHFFTDDSGCAYMHVDLLLRLKRSVDALQVIERMLTLFKPDDAFLDAALAVRNQIGPNTIDPVRYLLGISVSLCMIMKDEAANLSTCLASLKPIVDEIIIADTGSIDSSVSIARIFGARVIDVPWTGDYSAARNESLEQAKGNWILVMDADEVISSLDHNRFSSLIESLSGKMTACTIETRNYTNRVDLENWRANMGEYPTEESGRGWMPSDKVRLFPNLKEIRFENPIHEMVESAIARFGIPDPKCDIPVHHYGYLDDQRQQRKLMYYYELGKKKFEESGGAPHAVVELAIQAASIGRYDEAVDLWLRALEFDPVSSLAFFNLGHAYLQKGMFLKGRDACQRAMDLRDNYREALINKLICELCLGSGENQLEIIEASCLINPDYPLLQLMHGVVLAVVGKTEDALVDFRSLLAAQVDFSRFIHEVAVKLLMASRIKETEQLILAAGLAGICLPETSALIDQ